MMRFVNTSKSPKRPNSVRMTNGRCEKKERSIYIIQLYSWAN